MSFSAPQSKMPSPAHSPRPSLEVGDRAADKGSTPIQAAANSPAGIVNMGMTCFLNSTFQALSATPALISLLSSTPTMPLVPVPTTQLPPPPQQPSLTPCLGPDVLEPPLFNMLPVTRAFTNSLHKAWQVKDNGGGTRGSSDSSSRHNITLRQLLRELARKYDQYDEFAQQDAHELLRHLLDSMEMEEKDVIKKRKEMVETASIKSAPVQGSATAGPLPPTSTSTSTTPAFGQSVEPQFPPSLAPPPMEDRPRRGSMTSSLYLDPCVPFVDVLFGGLLASVVVCETCKSVSHTYEGFLDISLSMRSDDARRAGRRRDRLRAMFKPRPLSSASKFSDAAVMSEPEGDDDRSHLGVGARHRRERTSHYQSSDAEDPQSSTMSLGRSVSSSKRIGRAFTFRRKMGRTSSAQNSQTSTDGNDSRSEARSEADSPAPTPPVIRTPEPGTPGATTPMPGSPRLGPSDIHPCGKTHSHPHQATPTPAQLAYIQRILYGPPAPPEAIDPLAKLRAAHAGGLAAANGSGSKPDYGLIDSLKSFTSVEVLEGDNAFACHKCWKIKNGHYVKQRRDLGGKTSGVLAAAAAAAAAVVPTSSSSSAVPAIAVDGSKTNGSATAQNGDSGGIGRWAANATRGLRAPSPLRRKSDRSVTSDKSAKPDKDDGAQTGSDERDIGRVDSVSSTDTGDSSTSTETADSIGSPLITVTSTTTVATTEPSTNIGLDGKNSAAAVSPDLSLSESFDALDVTDADADEVDSDGLSDSTDDEELPTGPGRGGHFFRHRRQSVHKHFVLRRAFKRYLIAKAPEVLVFHIKRFKQTTSALYSSFSNLKKLDDFVSFPEVLDMSPFLAPNRNDFKLVQTAHGMRAPYMDWPSAEQGPDVPPLPYKLYAVVVHMGTMVGGHYIAYVLVDPERVFIDPVHQGANVAAVAIGDRLSQAADDKPKKDRRVWCYCSDTEIRRATVDEVLNARAYLCFYEKV